MKKLLFVLLLSFTAFNLFAESAEISAHPLDTDNDGLVSIEEAKPDDTLSAIFAELDINQDGYLSQMELEVKTESEIN